VTQRDWWIWKYIGERDLLNNIGLKLSSEQIDNFLNSFMEIFDNDWYNSIPEEKRERILNWDFRFNCGPYSVTRIIRLGECLLNLKNINGFDDEIVTRLKDRKQFESALIELDCSSCFIQNKMELEIQPFIIQGDENLNSKKADGKVIINGKPIFYEITNQNKEKNEIKRIKYSNKISDFLKEKFGLKETHIKFKKRDSDAKTTIKKIKEILKNASSPFDYEDNDIKIQIKDVNGSSSIEGDILNREKILENWIRNVHDKYNQLPTNVGGVIIANSSRLWDNEDIEIVQKTSWRKTKDGHKSRISGIIFCKRQMLGIPSISGERISFVSPLLLINRYSRFDYTDELKEMASALGRFPIWL